MLFHLVGRHGAAVHSQITVLVGENVIFFMVRQGPSDRIEIILQGMEYQSVLSQLG